MTHTTSRETIPNLLFVVSIQIEDKGTTIAGELASAGRPVLSGSREVFHMRTFMRICVELMVVTATALFAVSPSYSLDLSHILGGNENQDLSTFKLIHVTDLK